jgi:hypothetical protein
MPWPIDRLDGPTIVVFIGALTSAIGVLWFSAERIRSQRELRQMSERIAAKNEEIAAQSQEIAALNREIKDSVIGGDSFCYVVLSNLSARTALLGVIHQGQYPVYDVGIRIVDLEKYDRLGGTITLEKMAQTDTRLNVGNLGPSQTAMWLSWPLPDADQQRYNIFISARNGFVTQILRLRRVNGEWKSATKVQRDFDQNAVVLYERIDPEFPRDTAGQVQWEEQKRPTTAEPTP